jgi:hypothetical protein
MKKTDSLESLKELLQEVQFSAYRSYSLRNDQWKVVTSPLPGNFADTFHAIFLASAVTPGQTNPNGLEICVRSEDQPDIRESAEMNRAGKLVIKDLPIGHRLKLEIPDKPSPELTEESQKPQPQVFAAATERLALAAKFPQSGSKAIDIVDFPAGHPVEAEIAETPAFGQILLFECRDQPGTAIDFDLEGQTLTLHLDAEGRAAAFIPTRVHPAECMLRFQRFL